VERGGSFASFAKIGNALHFKQKGKNKKAKIKKGEIFRNLLFFLSQFLKKTSNFPYIFVVIKLRIKKISFDCGQIKFR
jgi:hypothetical protein